MKVMSLPQVLSKVDTVLKKFDIAKATVTSVRKELVQTFHKFILQEFNKEINDHVSMAIKNAKGGVVVAEPASSSTEVSSAVVESAAVAIAPSVVEESDVHISVIDTDEGALMSTDELSGTAPPKKRGRKRVPVASPEPVASSDPVASDALQVEQPSTENMSLGDGAQEALNYTSPGRRGACIHGKAFRSKCAICRDCGHGRVKDQCVICSDCGHGKRKVHCKICCSCEHGKLKQHCLICTSCPHGVKKRYCNVCSGCPHGFLKIICPQCDGCIHGKRRVDCKVCNNCGHKKLKHDCKICSDCGHGKLRRKCNECREKDGKPPLTPGGADSNENASGEPKTRKRKLASLPTGLYSSFEDPATRLPSSVNSEDGEAGGYAEPVTSSFSTLASLAVHDSVDQLSAIILKSCPHGKAKKSSCAECNDCGHGKLKSKCPVCSDCSHGKTKTHCNICTGCVHGKRKSNCKICNDCGHGKTKSKCSICSNRNA